MTTDGDTIADLLPPRSKHVQFARPEPRRPEETATAEEYTAFARGRVGTRPQMMISFRKCTGEVFAFAYSMLTKIYSENPDRGFTLFFSDTQVHIEGEHLLQLFHYLIQHRVIEVVETERAMVFQAGGEYFISNIGFVNRQ
ncbi:MAG: hypothetical protein ACK526_13455 [Planctomyces sp.]